MFGVMKEIKEYEDSLKAYRDVKNSIDTALEKGRAEGRAEVARTMLERGMDVKTIAELSGLTEAEIERLSVR